MGKPREFWITDDGQVSEYLLSGEDVIHVREVTSRDAKKDSALKGLYARNGEIGYLRPLIKFLIREGI
jgi:hypothetical protein